ncbi:contractile injection system protein, VgrG/Pvc8 family [Kribbella sp. NPDC050820]|uniref:phage late control D family protein n=1 Tax=Kribbella sp. NPDC050820 TaxID=3155408 RepID=UPI0033DF54B3
MTTAVPITTGADKETRDFYVPGFLLTSRGGELPAQVVHDVTQVSYGDDLAKIDHVEITVSNWDDEKYTFSYSDGDRFMPGKEIELWLGYQGQGNKLRRMITAEITSMKPTFPAGGAPTLVVGGLNVLHRLRGKQQSRKFENLTASQIAQKVADGLNVSLRTAPRNESPYPYLLQDKEFDLLFLMTLARWHNYDIFVEEGQDKLGRPRVYFGPTDGTDQVVYKLHYGATLTQFDPILSTARQVESVTVQAWDRLQKKKIEVTVDRSDLGLGKLDGELQQAVKDRGEVVTATVANRAEAEQVARDRLREIAQGTVTASGSVVGLPDLRAGAVVEISGVGTRFSGRYEVMSSTHTLGSSGYTTAFTCRRERGE